MTDWMPRFFSFARNLVWFPGGALAVTILSAGCASWPFTGGETTVAGQPAPTSLEMRAIAEEAFIYGWPMIEVYRTMQDGCLDPASPRYKGPVNTRLSGDGAFPPADAAAIPQDPGTPVLFSVLDLRAEPVMITIPEMPVERYNVLQLVDLYSCNYAYAGTRATGNAGGTFLVAGPGWTGETPAGIYQSFRCETQFSLALFRIQQFNPGDLDNVKRLQDGVRVQTLSAFLRRPLPAAPPAAVFPKVTEAAVGTDFPAFLDFLLSFCPEVKADAALRECFAGIGIGPGRKYAFSDLSPRQQAAVEQGLEAGREKVRRKRETLGWAANGWRALFQSGNRSYYDGNYLLRAASNAAVSFGGGEAEEICYLLEADADGRRPDGAKTYTLTFSTGSLPPANAFCSMELAENRPSSPAAAGRSLIRSTMLAEMKKDEKGNLTLYVQNASPGPDKESNWLAVPTGEFRLVMRLHWPKRGSVGGSWMPPALKPVK